MTTADPIRGHDEVLRRLESLRAQDRIPGGLLFTGEEGRGKRSLAIHWAKVLLGGGTDGVHDPDGAVARRIDAGDHPDFHLVQPAAGQRQIGIDQIRELKAAFGLKPAEAPRRVAVVARAHRLTDEAGNALLKLLEEPPRDSHLVLTSPSRETLMETLVSRCQHLHLGPVSRDDLRALLRERGVAEGRVEVLVALAEGAPGRVLDASGGAEALDLLAPALALLLPSGEGPLARAEALVALVREGTENLEEARKKLRPVLSLLVQLHRAALRRAHGAARGTEVLDLLPVEARQPLTAATPDQLEARLQRLVEVGERLDHNVSLDLLAGNLSQVMTAT